MTYYALFIIAFVISLFTPFLSAKIILGIICFILTGSQIAYMNGWLD